MNAHNLTLTLIAYRYWILIPLAFIEGPVIAFIAGTLASLHYFNIYALIVIFFVRDIGLDAVYYFIGYFGGRTRFVKHMLAKISITQRNLVAVRETWNAHPGRTMFIGKLSYGIAQAFIIVAGMVKMPIATFFQYGIVVAVAQYGTLLALGYFLGNALGSGFSTTLEDIQFFIAVVMVAITLYYVFSWCMRKKFLKHHIK